MSIELDTPVDEVMTRWPATIRTFLDHKMLCVGCPVGPFHTVEDACREHGIEPLGFLAAARAQAESAVIDRKPL